MARRHCSRRIAAVLTLSAGLVAGAVADTDIQRTATGAAGQETAQQLPAAAKPSSIRPVLQPDVAAGSMAQDLARIWELALERDPGYAAIRHQRQADQEIVPQARARLLPQISAHAGAEATESRRRRSLSRGSDHQRALWSLTLSQPLVDIRAWDALEQAQYVARGADVTAAQAYQALILRVTQAYFDVLAAQDTVRVLQAQKLAIETQLRAARHEFELGSTTITDTHEAQARLDLLRASEFNALNALQVSRDALASLIGEAPGTLAELPADTQLPAPAPDRLDDWLEQTSHANLAVARAQLHLKIAEKQLDMARSDRYPRLQLQAQTGSASDRGIHGGRPDPGPRSIDSSVGVTLSIPLYTGGGLSSVIREQSSRLQQARYDLEAARRTARQSTQQYFSGVTSGLAQIQALQAAEASSQAALDANQIAYEVGVRINIDVLNAQQQLYETQRQLSRLRYDTLMHSLHLKASSGMLAEDDIFTINALLHPPASGPLQP